MIERLRDSYSRMVSDVASVQAARADVVGSEAGMMPVVRGQEVFAIAAVVVVVVAAAVGPAPVAQERRASSK